MGSLLFLFYPLLIHLSQKSAPLQVTIVLTVRDTLAGNMIDAANAKGGHDNISVVLIRSGE